MSKISVYRDVQEKLLNRLMQVIGIVAFPVVGISIFRAIQIGWQMSFALHLATLPFTTFFWIFRQSLPYVSKVTYIILLFFVTAVFSFINFATGANAIPFLLICVLIAVIFWNKKGAFGICIASATIIILMGGLTLYGVLSPKINWETYHLTYTSWLNTLNTFAILLCVVIVIVGGIGQLLNAKIMEFNQAISEIKTLQGIIPICAICKKIRNDKGYWEQVEIYVKNHTEADFSHSLCPECAKKQYPDLFPNEAPI